MIEKMTFKVIVLTILWPITMILIVLIQIGALK